MNKINYAPVFFTAVVVIAVFAGLVPSVVGTNGGSALFEELKPMVDVYNQNIENIPVIKSFIGEERIHGEIALNEGTVLILGITTDANAKVTGLQEGAISDPTIRAYTDENTVRPIITAADPIAAFQDALTSGAIRYEGVTFGDKLKVGVMKVALKIAGFFM